MHLVSVRLLCYFGVMPVSLTIVLPCWFHGNFTFIFVVSKHKSEAVYGFGAEQVHFVPLLMLVLSPECCTGGQ